MKEVQCMKFKTVYKAVFLIAISADFLDYLFTEIGFIRFTPYLETNLFIRFLMRWIDPHLASTTVFGVTLVMIIVAYKYTSGYLGEQPYSQELGNVLHYLWTGGTFNIRDAAIFASMTLSIMVAYIHFLAFLEWLHLLFGF